MYSRWYWDVHTAPLRRRGVRESAYSRDLADVDSYSPCHVSLDYSPRPTHARQHTLRLTHTARILLCCCLRWNSNSTACAHHILFTVHPLGRTGVSKALFRPGEPCPGVGTASAGRGHSQGRPAVHPHDHPPASRRPGEGPAQVTGPGAAGQDRAGRGPGAQPIHPSRPPAAPSRPRAPPGAAPPAPPSSAQAREEPRGGARSACAEGARHGKPSSPPGFESAIRAFGLARSSVYKHTALATGEG